MASQRYKYRQAIAMPLTQKIRWALQQTNLRPTVGAAGRERVIQNFSWKITAERTVEHYRALLSEMSVNAHS